MRRSHCRLCSPRSFQTVNGAPAWATNARKRREAEPVEDEPLDATGLLQPAAKKGKRRGRGAIKAGTIAMERLRDVTAVGHAKMRIESLGFHPSVNVLYTASSDRRLRLYQVDGSANALLQTVHTPDLPLTSASFHPSGSSILLSGPRPFFHSYDLQTGRTSRSSPRVLGSLDEGAAMDRARFSADGRTLAFAGRRGNVHLLDWSAGGAGACSSVGSLKANGTIRDLAFSPDGHELIGVTEQSEVYVWDVRAQACVTRWRDDGGFGASTLATDRAGEHLAIGSSTGVVNLYDQPSALAATADVGAERKARKSVMNLVTAISAMSFNHDGAVLATASSAKRDALKLTHVASGSVFSNWPSAGTPLGHVSAVDFSRASEYLAVGNERGSVLLYSVRHYAGRS